eukprot:gnl/Spiro4/4157_TR2078_c0_g1_i1.p1 gnl/Spiro4/4157_TR2078_c0_g1~~gnl/Spiro4/4157_TR2078_c0_g1_i1.p1  ORF type:complete len:127 (-),score=32.73 gnl/Spiro4/4157_TR2078_c0_g1_i1:202-552(-)
MSTDSPAGSSSSPNRNSVEASEEVRARTPPPAGSISSSLAGVRTSLGALMAKQRPPLVEASIQALGAGDSANARKVVTVTSSDLPPPKPGDPRSKVYKCGATLQAFLGGTVTPKKP